MCVDCRQPIPIALSTLDASKVVAAKMVDQLVETAVQFPGYVSLDAVATRYGIDPRRHSGEEYLHLVAQVRRGKEACCHVNHVGVVSAIVCVCVFGAVFSCMLFFTCAMFVQLYFYTVRGTCAFVWVLGEQARSCVRVSDGGKAM